MKTRADVLLWAQRVLALHGQPAHRIMDLPPDCSVDAATQAFHAIAKMAHPDLHRRSLTAEELETVELAYARAAGAYQELRGQRMQTTRLRPVKDDPLGGLPVSRPWEPKAPAPPPAPTPAPTSTPPSGSPTAGAGGPGAMSGKALLYYRKAELALRRGDLKGALLQMKMAIAGDPQSAFLRNALAELQAELAKK